MSSRLQLTPPLPLTIFMTREWEVLSYQVQAGRPIGRTVSGARLVVTADPLVWQLELLIGPLWVGDENRVLAMVGREVEVLMDEPPQPPERNLEGTTVHDPPDPPEYLAWESDRVLAYPGNTYLLYPGLSGLVPSTSMGRSDGVLRFVLWGQANKMVLTRAVPSPIGQNRFAGVKWRLTFQSGGS